MSYPKLDDKIDELRQFCMGISDDKDFKEQVAVASVEELIELLLDNGFDFEITEP